MDSKKGTLYWITGLSGAGKTTIGTMLYSYLKTKKDNVILLDGDILREVYQYKDYSQEGRNHLSHQYSRLCKMLTDQNMDVVICIIAMFDDCREWNRINIPNYKEIYLKVSIEELIKRDQKKLYSRAINKEISDVMGIDIEFDEPKQANLVIDNSGDFSVTQVLDIIIDKLAI